MKVKKYKIGLIIAISLIMIFANNSRATIIEYPLDCAGTYTVSSWTADFDLGVEFIDISHVYIDWEGEITAGLVVFQSEPENPVPIDVGITSILGEAPLWRHTTILGGKLTYPNSEPFDIISEFTKGSMPWSELYDGIGRISISHSVGSLIYGRYVELGSVQLSNATLIVEGTEIPEPATIALLGVGVIGMRLRRKKLKKIA